MKEIIILLVPLLELFLLSRFTIITYQISSYYLFVGFSALYLLLQEISKKNNVLSKLNFKIVALNLFLSAFYIGITLIIKKDLSLLTSYVSVFFILLLSFFVFFTSIFYFIDLNLVFKHRFKFLFLLPLSFVIVVYPVLNDFAWMYLCSSTCRLASSVINLLGFDNVSIINNLTLSCPLFKISIYSPCSGLEGVLMFVTAFSIFLLQLNDDLLKSKSVFLGYFIGIYYMYFLNIVRIVSYFIFGMSVAETSGSGDGAKAIIKLYHSNVGWLLYFIGISIYIGVWSYVSRKANTVKS
jgi:exosortase/archaeosortase family protein